MQYIRVKGGRQELDNCDFVLINIDNKRRNSSSHLNLKILLDKNSIKE